MKKGRKFTDAPLISSPYTKANKVTVKEKRDSKRTRAGVPSFLPPSEENAEDSNPKPETKSTATPEENTPNTNFWVCLTTSDGTMLKLKTNFQETTSDFCESAVKQLESIIFQIQQQNISIQTQHQTQEPPLPLNVKMAEHNYVREVLQQKQVPMLYLPDVPKYLTNTKNIQSKNQLSTSEFPLQSQNQDVSPSPVLSRSKNHPLFGANNSSGVIRKNKFKEMLSSVPLSFDEIPEGNDREKTQTFLIESILVDSYAKLKLFDEDDEESALFKTTVLPTAKKLQKKTKMSYSYAQITYVPWPSSLQTKFQATFNYFTENVSKTLDIEPSTKVIDAIHQLISRSHISSIRAKDPKGVVLKLCDFNEYLDNKMTFGMLVAVRNYLKRRKLLRFSLVDKVDVAKTYLVPEELDYEYKPRNDVDVFSLVAPPIPAKNSVSSLDLDYNFQVRVLEVNGIARYFPLYAEQNDDTSFQISVELYHGSLLLAPPIWNEAQIDAQFDEWVGSPSLKVCQIPRASKVCFTLYVKNYKEMIPLGWVNVQLFDHHNALKSGVFTLPLWLNGKANPLAPCALNIENTKPMTLSIEFAAYSDSIVTYPSFRHLLYSSSIIPKQEDPSLVLNYRMEVLINQDPLYLLSQSEKISLWDSRELLSVRSGALPKVLQAVDWTNPEMASEAIQNMVSWSPLTGSSALQLLDAHFPVPEVREYAINCLRTVPDIDLADYLLQLVQVLKYEPYHDSPLLRFLLQRALENRERIGHLLFWYLKSELKVPNISQRYTLLMEAYLYGCGDHLFELIHQTQLVDKLQSIAELVKSKKKGRKAALDKELSDLRFDQRILLPIVPGVAIHGFNIPKCKYMDSFTVPLWLECRNFDPYGSPMKVIFKKGDDLRADILILQMFRLMDKLWQSAGLDMNLSPYMCTATDLESGMIEVVPDSVTTAAIHKEVGVVTGALKKTPLAKWLQEKNPSDHLYNQAVDNFITSLAGYCVATFILGIGDRHNDNIMITSSGHLFHIDFAHILGNVQTWQGIKRERAPFVLTPEFVYVMGKRKGPNFKRFLNLCCKAYNVLRKQANLFINLFSMMLSTGIPELQCDEDINYLRNAFALGKTEREAAKFFISLIDESLNTKATQVNFLIHNLAHVT